MIASKKSSNSTSVKELKTLSDSKVIGFVSQKGGVGKSTTAMHGYTWFSQYGSTILVDADAQQSSSKWLAAMIPTASHAVIKEASNLLKELPKLKQQFHYVIVDAPGSMEEVSRAILSRCDIVVVPCQPASLDLESNLKTIEMIDIIQDIRGGMPLAAIFLNRAEEGTILLREAEAALCKDLQDTQIHHLQTVIHKRQCITDVAGQRTTVFQAANEIEARKKPLLTKTQRKKRKTESKEPSEVTARNEYNSLFSEIMRMLNG